MRVAIAFADLAGYTRLTEEAGEEEALEVVERFVEHVDRDAPDDARVIKTIGDEVMVVGTTPRRSPTGPSASRSCTTSARCRGSACTRAACSTATATTTAARSTSPSRVGARATGGEVLVTREVMDAAGRHLAVRAASARSAQGLRRGRPSCSSPGRGAMSAATRRGARRAPRGLLGGPVVVMLSGGRDSVCLLDLARAVAGAGGARPARQLRAARRGRRGRGPLRRSSARGSAWRSSAARGRAEGQRAGVGARGPLRRGGGTRWTARSPSATRRPTRPRRSSSGSSPGRRALLGHAGALRPRRAAAAGA